jgi:type VI secretion system ImpA family protein
MTSEIEVLLAPVLASGDPCGPDLSEDAKRQELERVFDRDVSIPPNGQAGEAPRVVWSQIIDGLTAEFARSKDLRLAKNLCLAGAAGTRLETVALGVNILAGLVETYWDRVHPQLEEYGLVARVNVVSELNNRAIFLNPLRQVILFADKRGDYSGLDLIALAKEQAANPNFELFHAAVEENGDAPLLAACEVLDGMSAALRRVAAVYKAKGGAEGDISFRAVEEVIAELKQAATVFMRAPPAAVETAPVAGEAGQVAPKPAAKRIAGAVESREDVIRAIDAICAYYSRAEPASPILPLMQRAKVWVPMSFLQVLEDIEPDSVDAAKRVLLNKPSG